MLKITAVSYLNTYPFVFGLKVSGKLQDFQLDLQVPSLCAKKLIDNETDIALIPSGAIPDAGAIQYLTDYCIGAVRPVKTVLLLSRVPVEQIKTIHLDFDSRTSVKLVKVLAKHYWKINPEWISLQSGEAEAGRDYESLVAIGDKTFAIRQKYNYIYDMAEEWIRFTGTPFVFAVWATRKQIPCGILNDFNQALRFGVDHKPESVEYFRDQLPACGDCLDYLENNISYSFDSEKMRGLEKFLGYLGATDPDGVQPP